MTGDNPTLEAEARASLQAATGRSRADLRWEAGDMTRAELDYQDQAEGGAS